MLNNRRNKTVVLGLGNPLMRDEGIGTVLIEKFSANTDKFPGIDFIDGGTGGMSILYLIEDRQKVIIIDCAYMNTAPGTIKKFTPEQVESVKKLAHQSLHEIDISKVIELAGQLGNRPPQIIFFGIEPEKVEQGQGLSETLKSKMQTYLDTVTVELTQ
jgi:hydrogenase maturation protease